MAFNDTLFQLGMDLTRSSTAQEEDRRVAAPVAHDDQAQVAHDRSALVARNDDRKDFFVERNGKRFAGTHLIVDLFGARRLDDLKHIEATLKRCAKAAGATLLNVHLHHFTPNGGVSGVAVLAESHISIHSWPEADYAALDVFMCGDAEPEKCIEILREAFSVRDVVVKTHHRGSELSDLKWQAAAQHKSAPVRLKGVRRPKRAA